MRLIGAGVGRTGTASLQLALARLLDAPCYHMKAVFERPEDTVVWANAFAGDLPDWPTFLEPFAATVDWPACSFWSELSEVYPDAPILLSTRDPDAWWASADNTIFETMRRAFAANPEEMGPWIAMAQPMLERFSPEWSDAEPAKAAFVAHNENVRRLVPAERLVEWRPGDGWAPLCEALRVPIPDEPFPHTNTTEEFRAMAGLDQPDPA